ncbi:growth hormone receptor-like [Engraulis encrasicolus]|uniref:growth hormone receptor-like n=1 Tax=Engraulis encrasicolus TaxID=184585 RepID=UPI002FCEC9C3
MLCAMQCFVVFTLASVAVSIAAHEAHSRGDAMQTTRKPQIYYCRSSNMETFTCWWHPLEDASYGSEKINYTFTYTIGNEHVPRECPDYVTGGAQSCFFDMAHTRVWEVYCMNVTARTSRGVFTSAEHCIDVADIVEIDPPFNLTYMLMNSSEGESSRTALVSWSYPIPSLVHIGWITLIYELRFWSIADPDNWKDKGDLREPQLTLLDLPAGNYEVMVRCKSKNNKIWSQWSSVLSINVPSRRAGDRLLALILITGVGVMAVFIIGFGIIPQSKRIKSLLLPPIPKPRIRGLDPLLLKKGKMDEINRHFSSFSGYKSPEYREETWYQVYTDEGLPHHNRHLQPAPANEAVAPAITEQRAYSPSQPIMAASDGSRHCLDPSPYIESLNPQVREAMDDPVFPQAGVPNPWAAHFGLSHPQVSGPNPNYCLIMNSDPHGTTAMPLPAGTPLQDFYTCVSVIGPSGAVHLAPCFPEVVAKNAGAQHNTNNTLHGEGGGEKSSQYVTHSLKKVEEELDGESACLIQGESRHTQVAK